MSDRATAIIINSKLKSISIVQYMFQLQTMTIMMKYKHYVKILRKL